MSKSVPKYDVDILRRIEDSTLNDQELARNANILKDIKLSDSKISTFYKDKCILITGATGFVGKVLLEKLLRTCPDVKAIFLLIRRKDGVDIKERINEFFKQTIFGKLSHECPNFRKKIFPIEADIEQLKLGLKPEDCEKIKQEVSVIFHAAAADRYNESLRKTILVNVRGTAELLRLAYGCAKLSAMVYFSTAYSNPYDEKIKEEFYDVATKAEDLINMAQNNSDLDEMASDLIGEFPDSFTFTKAVTENLIRAHGNGVPICVFRPSNIIGTYREPLRGWADNINGVSSILVGAGLGLIHNFCCDPKKTIDIVPVDMVANASIACSWRTSLNGLRSEGPIIYNYVSSCQKPISWGKFYELNKEYIIKLATVQAVWSHFFMLTKCKYFFMLSMIFAHLKAYILDNIYKFLGKDTEILKMFKTIKKINNHISNYISKDWKFSNNNVENLWTKLSITDQHIYEFNVELIEWERLTETNFMGLRVYFLKDPATTLAEGRKKFQRLKYTHQAILQVFPILLLIIILYLYI